MVFVGISQGVNLKGRSCSNWALPSERKPLPRGETFNSACDGFKSGTIFFKSNASPLISKTSAVGCFALSRTDFVDPLPSVVQLPSRFNFAPSVLPFFSIVAQLDCHNVWRS